MLTILTGPDRVSLTNAVLRRLRDAAAAEQPGQILIVPEQFSHEAERNLCTFCGDTISRFAEVLSFTRLSDRLAASQGGVARAYLDRGGQLLTMALAAEQTVSRMKLFAPVLRKPEFLSDMVRMVTEFQSYCLTPELLREAARQEQGQFAEKLEELTLLYEAYLAVCANGRADPSDKLLRLIDTMMEGQWVVGKRFYLDGFSDFTGAELAALEGLLLHSEHVLLTLCTGAPGSSVEQLRRQTLRQLRRCAAKYEIPCQVIPCADLAPRDPAVQTLLPLLFSSRTVEPMESERISLSLYASQEEECRGAVQQIRELLTKGVRCREISVACTELSSYEAPLTAAFRAANLPMYLAGEEELLSKPLIGAVCGSILTASGSMEYEDVAQYLKSGLPLLERDRCDRLDNYAYLWNLRGTQWSRDWELHPRGFGEGWADADRQTLRTLNEDRTLALTPLLHLRAGLIGAKNTGDMVLAVYGFFEELQLRQRLAQRAEEDFASGNGRLAQELAQLYELLCQALEQLWLTLRGTVRTPEDFAHLFQSLLTQYHVATIPAGLDQIQVSSLPDLRYRVTPYLIVLGANDGLLPTYRSAEGILTEEERRRLQNHGLQIAPGRAEQLEQELGQIYTALLSATEFVGLSCCAEQPAWLFRRAAALCPDSVRRMEGETFLRPEELAAWKLRTGNRQFVNEQVEQLEQELDRRRSYRFDALEQHTVHGLYGAPLMLSPSKIDTFAACKLEYFLNYGLKAKPRKQARLDQPAFGTFVHAVLEHTVNRVMELGGFETVSSETVLDIATQEIRAYARELLPVQAERETYLFDRSEDEIRSIVLDLWEELRVSRFRPAYCELKFARDGLLPMVTVQGERTDCQIMGLVDRVDLFTDGEKTYVRIVDYKTGVKDFDYTDIENGAGLQMLIYLFALRAFGKDYLKTGPLEPAGVLYLPAKREYPLMEPQPDPGEVEEKHRELRRRKGLIRRDDRLLAAMEEDPENPRFMPYKVSQRSGVSGDLADSRQMVLLERHVIRTVGAMADQMAEGLVTPDPVVRGQNSPCRYCEYTAVCHRDLGLQQPRALAETRASEFWEKLEREEENHG